MRIGEEKVVADDMVVESGQTGTVTTRETVTERRTTGTLIRRRKVREVVSAPESALEEGALPAEVGFPQPPGEMISEELPPLAPEMPIVSSPRPVVEVAPPPPPPSVEAGEAAPPPAVAEAPAAKAPVGKAPAAPPAVAAPFRGARVLGRIDLRKVAPPPSPRSQQKPTPPSNETAEARVRRAEPGAKPAAPAEEEAKDKKRKKLKVIKKDVFETERDYRGGRMPKKRRALPGKEQHKTEITVPKASKRVVRISNVISVGELSKAMGIKAGEVLRKLMDLGIMATINQAIDFDTASLVAADFEYQIENVAFDAESAIEVEHEAPQEGEARELRPPVVTIMGHVDHGKTSLLDAVRKTNVTEGEAGGITQHIGAYSVTINGRRITFLDTPGHEAFTAMRARGAKVTDIVVLVVAADDGVMPQTVEAISHARAAGVPIVVAVNKIDKPDANLERVKRELADHGLAAEDWGGDTILVPVSAKTQQGIPELLEMLLLQADLLDLRANPGKLARGVIVEAKIERGRGPVATVLVQEGTLKAGAPFVCGTQYGKVRAMMDESGAKVEEAGPSMPVEIIGLQGVPEAGDVFTAVNDEATAREVAAHRLEKKRQTQLAATSKVSLEDLYHRIKTSETKELRVILKADVQGSVEAVQEAMSRLSTDEVKLTVLHASVGGVSESDVLLASASDAIIIGFNIRPEVKATELAEREGVEIRLYTIIYEALNDLRSALEGLLAPMIREKVLGRAEVRQPFSIPGVGTIAGSFVNDGKIMRSGRTRLLRDNVVVYEGKITSLRRFKEDVREVTSGYECGIGLENFNDLKPGDIIEVFELEEIARRLSSPSPKGSSAAERMA